MSTCVVDTSIERCKSGDQVLSISEGSVFPDYLEVHRGTAVVVPCGVGKTSPRTSV